MILILDKMKYTQYLLKGDYFKYQLYSPDQSFLKTLYHGIILLISCYLFSFCFLLLPVTLMTDFGRTLYCIELKIVRRSPMMNFMKKIPVRKLYYTAYRITGIF